MITTGPMPNEGARAYEAFKTYLGMGAQRSLVKLGQKLSKNIQTLKSWSAKFKWQERCAMAVVQEHEQDMIAQANAKMERARLLEARQKEVEEEGYLASREALKIARMILRQPLGRAKPSDAARLLQVADSMGRMSAQMPVTRAELTGKDGKPLNPIATPIIHVTIERTDASDEILKRFGERPSSRGG